jgi:hypothetical protein
MKLDLIILKFYYFILLAASALCAVGGCGLSLFQKASLFLGRSLIECFLADGAHEAQALPHDVRIEAGGLGRAGNGFSRNRTEGVSHQGHVLNGCNLGFATSHEKS